MFSWKVSCSTVLVFTVSPDDFWNAAVISAYAFLGTSSDWLDPKVTSLDPPPLSPSPPPQAASRLDRDRAAPVPRVPLRNPRRLMPAAATEGGTRLARYSDSVRGRDMAPPWVGGSTSRRAPPGSRRRRSR